MNNFNNILASAQRGDPECILTLLEMYQPLLTKMSTIGGVFDEDLYQEQSMTFLWCIRTFEMP